MQRKYFPMRLLALALGLVVPIWPSMMRGQQDTPASPTLFLSTEESAEAAPTTPGKPAQAKSTVKKESKEAKPKAPPKEKEKEDEQKPPDLLKQWTEELPKRVLPPIGIWAVEPSGPWFYSLADLFLDRVNFKPPPSPYGRYGLLAKPFFDASLDYLKAQSKSSEPISLFDALHPLYVDDEWLLSMGGELRWRYMDQREWPAQWQRQYLRFDSRAFVR